ncbi:MAG: hypothetical protein GY947_01530 [Rhodobacteraceae bacterium]|nr:hypothetical protein [Paracoccaceae bacterium]
MSIFETATRNAFAFLVDELGYEATVSLPDRVEYQSNGLVVTVSYDHNRSCELTVGLGSVNQLGPQFNFGETLRSCGAPVDLPSAYQVSDKNRLIHFLGELAENLRRYCTELLTGDAPAFDRLKRLREIECEAFERENKLRKVRSDANQAWATGNFQRVVRILQPHESELGKLEKRKLDFSRKKNSISH